MPTRRLMTKGLYNARDLGGFPTQDGRTTRFGVFVRSEAPCGLEAADIAYLKDYGVTASMDFRSTMEVQHRPSDLTAGMDYYHRPLFNEAAMAGSAVPKGAPIQHIGWGEQYIDMAEEARDWAKDVLTLAAKEQGAMLYHCTTGKDRTGLMTCYLLSIAGVAPADIAADYCVSQVYLAPVYEKMRSGMMHIGPAPEGMPEMPEMDESFFQTPASAMYQVMDYLTQQYGGVVEYLRTIGVPEEVMAAIREKFLEKP